jgi:hypothetical protein
VGRTGGDSFVGRTGGDGFVGRGREIRSPLVTKLQPGIVKLNRCSLSSGWLSVRDSCSPMFVPIDALSSAGAESGSIATSVSLSPSCSVHGAQHQVWSAF